MSEKKLVSTVEGKPEFITREPHLFYFEKNLRALDPEFFKQKQEALKAGKDDKDIRPTNPLIEKIFTTEEKVVKIDKSVQVAGLKNPLVISFIGFSTRRVYDAAMKSKLTTKHCYFIEPDIGIFKHLLMTEDISDILTNPDYQVIVGIPEEELLLNLFKLVTMVNPKTGKSRSASLLSMEKVNDPFVIFDNKEREQYAIRVAEIIDKTIHHAQLSMGCSDDQYRRWEMVHENRKAMLNSWNMSDCLEKFKNFPAIVCGGGPSLQEFIDACKKNPEIKENSVIIAADAVLKKLVDNGIKPHIVTRCERKTTNIFKGVTKDMTKGIYYAAYPWTPTPYFDLFDDCFYLFRSNGACVHTSIDHCRVDGGVSSGNAALEIALNFGCKEIFLTGLDLCMGKEGQTHIGGTQVEFDINKSKAKWTKIKCNDGKERTTIPVWVRCWNEYSQGIKKRQEMFPKLPFTVYNTATEGAEITRTSFLPWDKALKKFKTKRNAETIFKMNRKKLSDKTKEDYYEVLRNLYKFTKEFIESTNIVIGLAADSERTFRGECNKIISQMVTQHTGYELVQGIPTVKKNMEKLLTYWVDVYDKEWKMKWFNQGFTRLFFFDVLQLDVFQYENEISSLVNRHRDRDDRSYDYCMITKRVITKFMYYATSLRDLLEKVFAEDGLDINDLRENSIEWHGSFFEKEKK